ncbi:hypothetical protein P9578_16055 [Brevibacillus choshinensis]|uniref:hypothetical protein n=1 Tax=Brevibacillus choshinensis TaxID=54911 RepID=UPI002E1E5379|nr:hypothetical protein [Brevibacillus choshinensis]
MIIRIFGTIPVNPITPVIVLNVGLAGFVSITETSPDVLPRCTISYIRQPLLI